MLVIAELLPPLMWLVLIGFTQFLLSKNHLNTIYFDFVRTRLQIPTTDIPRYKVFVAVNKPIIFNLIVSLNGYNFRPHIFHNA